MTMPTTKRGDVLEGLEGFTPGPWERRPREGDWSSHEIHAPVNIGGDEHGAVLQPIYDVPIRPDLQVGSDGRVYATLSYDSYRQFPSLDFRAMQEANAELQARAPELVAEIRKLREAVRELERGAMYATDMLMTEPSDPAATRLMGDRVIIHRATWDALRALLPEEGA